MDIIPFPLIAIIIICFALVMLYRFFDDEFKDRFPGLMVVALLLMSSCAREFTLPFDGLYFGRDVCNDSNPCTMDIYFWKLQQNHDTTFYCNNSMIADCDTTSYCDTVNCDDNTFCTNDWCDTIRQICQQQYACDDGDACTNDDCEGIYCIYEPINCNDTDNCTNDICAGGVCINITVNCDDGRSCTMDACVPQDGICENVDTCTIVPPCDTVPDPNYYDPTFGDSYCKLIICGQNTVRSCNDGDPCTNDYCVEGLRECVNSDVNCDDGSDCVNTGTCWCDNGYCVYGSGKRIAVEEVKRMQAEQNFVTESFLYSIEGKLLALILRDQVKEFAMLFAHSDYPSGMYLLKSGSRTTRLIKP